MVSVLLNLNPHKKTLSKQSKSAENLLARMNSEMEAELVEARKQKETYVMERNSLLDSLKRTNEEFILLKKKRIQDVCLFHLTFDEISTYYQLHVRNVQKPFTNK